MLGTALSGPRKRRYERPGRLRRGASRTSGPSATGVGNDLVGVSLDEDKTATEPPPSTHPQPSHSAAMHSVPAPSALWVARTSNSELNASLGSSPIRGYPTSHADEQRSRTDARPVRRQNWASGCTARSVAAATSAHRTRRP